MRHHQQAWEGQNTRIIGKMRHLSFAAGMACALLCGAPDCPELQVKPIAVLGALSSSAAGRPDCLRDLTAECPAGSAWGQSAPAAKHLLTDLPPASLDVHSQYWVPKYPELQFPAGSKVCKATQYDVEPG